MDSTNRRPYKRARESLSPRRSPPKSPPRKRPGASSRIGADARRAADQRRQQREEEERKALAARTNDDLVSAHYNAVPERGRDWRKTGSQIPGLRSLNNWVKSAIIQKFSRPDNPPNDLLVLDIGCGKGGDLQKWQSAPQRPALYVGIDPAEVSIDQARSRFEQMKRRNRGPRQRTPQPFEGHFFVQDCFGKSLGGIPIIRDVGFNPNAGPDANGNIVGGSRDRGFDVISMMFCLHYSFENEEKAKGMLKNISGALKKGGRFLGVMPNSDVITAHVERHFKKAALSKKANEDKADEDDDTWDPEKPAAADDDNDDWDPEKPAAATDNDDAWDPEKPSAAGEDDWDPEKPSAPADDDTWDPEASLEKTPVAATPAKELPPLEWGNSIYTVKFPQTRPLPTDGIFRPPYGWKYFYYLSEAVDVPEYVVPWEGFRALAEEYGLVLLYRKPFNKVWEDEKDDPVLGPLSMRMNVVDKDGKINVSPEEMEAASFYHAFCFYKI